jgi:hypothetical protein
LITTMLCGSCCQQVTSTRSGSSPTLTLVATWPYMEVISMIATQLRVGPWCTPEMTTMLCGRFISWLPPATRLPHQRKPLQRIRQRLPQRSPRWLPQRLPQPLPRRTAPSSRSSDTPRSRGRTLSDLATPRRETIWSATLVPASPRPISYLTAARWATSTVSLSRRGSTQNSVGKSSTDRRMAIHGPRWSTGLSVVAPIAKSTVRFRRGRDSFGFGSQMSVVFTTAIGGFAGKRKYSVAALRCPSQRPPRRAQHQR